MTVYPAPEQRRLARRIARTARETRALGRADQAAFRGVDVSDGPLQLYDENGNLIYQFGKMDDTGKFIGGPSSTTPPPQPETPEIVPAYGGFIVRYDGTYVNANVPDDFSRTEIYVGTTAGFTKDDTTQVNAYMSPDGGDCFVGYVDTGTLYVSLITYNTSGLASAASVEVTATSGGPFWKHEKFTAVTADETATNKVMSLAYKPLTSSLQVAWNGLVQPATEYSLTGKQLTWPTQSLMKAGDEIEAHYQYLIVPTVPVAPTVPGAVGRGDNNLSGTYNVALPASAQVGDFAVVCAMNYGGNNCADSRFTRVGGTYQGCRVWAGTLTSLAAVPISFTPGGGNDWSVYSITVFRGTGGAPIVLSNTIYPFSGVGDTGNLPAVPAGYSGAICIWTHTDGIGGVYGDQNWSRSPGWSLKSEYEASYSEVDVALAVTSPLAAALVPSTDGNSNWSGFIVPIENLDVGLYG